MKKLLVILWVFSFLIVTPCATYSIEKEKPPFADYKENLKNIIAKGKLYLKNAHYKKAINYFDYVVFNYPRSPASYYYLGVAYYGRGNLQNAEKSLNKAIKLNPRHTHAYYHLALIEHRRGNREKVIEYLDKVTSLDSTFQKAYYNKGTTFLSLGMPERSYKEFAYSLHLKPTDYPSLIGFLETCVRLKLIEIDESSLQNPDKVKFTVQIPSSPAPSALDGQPISPEKGEDMRIFLSSPFGKREVMLKDGVPVKLNSLKNMKEVLEINFPKPADLQNKIIRIQVKGENGNEKVKVVLRDTSTGRSPPFYLNGISKKWKTFSINTNREAYNLNLDKIEHFRLELLPSQNPGKDKGSRAFIKDIEII